MYGQKTLRFALFLAAGLFGTTLFLGCERDETGAGTARRGPRPNVLLVTLDTTRADRLSCYGFRFHGRRTTPHLDQFAKEGAIFRKAYATSGSTPPSHASILTGLDPDQHGVRVIYADSGYRLPDDVPTLATVLRQAGWQTAAFLSSFTVSEFYGFDRGFEHFDNGLPDFEKDPFDQNRKGGIYNLTLTENERRSDQTVNAFLDWYARRNTDKPFFAWVHFWDPHDEGLVPPEALLNEFLTSGSKVTMAALMDLYAAEVAYVDSQFGRLIEHLKKTGEYDNTIVVVVADHGEGLGEHDWWKHRLLYEEQIHVPMIIRLPGQDGGREVRQLVSTVDIFPTVLAALSLPFPASTRKRAGGAKWLPGIDLSEIILADNEPDTAAESAESASREGRVTYAEALNKFDRNAAVDGMRPEDELLYVATDGVWKLIYKPTHIADSELYNLQEDPDEFYNLYAKRHPQLQRLRAFLDRKSPFVEKPFPPMADSPDSKEIERARQRLRSLGYAGEEDDG